MENNEKPNIKIFIFDSFKKIISRGNYETLIETLMNASQCVFKGEYEHINSQAYGECDFIEKSTGEKFDAKLCFEKEEGKLIGAPNGDVKEWILKMNEYFTDVDANLEPENLKIYKLLEKKMNSLKDDENLILYIPFPLSMYVQGVHEIVVTNTIEIAYNELNEKNLLKGRKIYVIFPIDSGMALYDVKQRKYEPIKTPIFNEYIKYENI